MGTRYFVCCITGTTGGMVYSSVLPVTVVADVPVESTTEPTEPPTETEFTELTTAAPTTAPTTAEPATEPSASQSLTVSSPAEDTAAFPVWGYAAVALGGIAAGVATAFLLNRGKKQ